MRLHSSYLPSSSFEILDECNDGVFAGLAKLGIIEMLDIELILCQNTFIAQLFHKHANMLLCKLNVTAKTLVSICLRYSMLKLAFNYSNSTITWSVFKVAPALQETLFTTPFFSARKVFCIFMASTTAMG